MSFLYYIKYCPKAFQPDYWVLIIGSVKSHNYMLNSLKIYQYFTWYIMKYFWNICIVHFWNIFLFPNFMSNHFECSYLNNRQFNSIDRTNPVMLVCTKIPQNHRTSSFEWTFCELSRILNCPPVEIFGNTAFSYHTTKNFSF